MHMNYPFIQRPIHYQSINYEEELYKIRHEIEKLKERINTLEQANKNNYLKKDDMLQMM